MNTLVHPVTHGEGGALRQKMTAFYTHDECKLHDVGPWHPERPARLSAIEDQMIASGLGASLLYVEAPLADDTDILRVHGADYLEEIKRTAPEHGLAELDPDTLMSPGTLAAVWRGAGAAVAATDAVISGAIRNAFCSVRPPGHHACTSRAMGFCIVNNVAVAAMRALEVHGLERVAIIDFDVHHGNGTEEIFSGDERVVMASFFQHPFYPYSGFQGSATNMFNVPLPAYSDGAAVRAAVERRWTPALERFAPQMVFISAGFDAHREDDLGQMRLTEDDYVYLTKYIMDVANRHAGGRIVSCLEGGYNLSALGRSVVAHVRSLAQD